MYVCIDTRARERLLGLNGLCPTGNNSWELGEKDSLFACTSFEVQDSPIRLTLGVGAGPSFLVVFVWHLLSEESRE